MHKIAISGKAGSGKDTASRYINECFRDLSLDRRIYSSLEQSKFRVRSAAFADPIKEMILQMYPDLPREYLFGDSKYRSEVIPNSFYNGNPLTIRVLLQEMGEGCKKYNPKIWIDAFDVKFKLAQAQNVDLFIASDLRFIDEFNYLKENNFYLVRIVRGEDVGMSHVSETQQKQIKDSDFDKIIDNNGTLGDLRMKIDEIVKSLKG